MKLSNLISPVSWHIHETFTHVLDLYSAKRSNFHNKNADIFPAIHMSKSPSIYES